MSSSTGVKPGFAAQGFSWENYIRYRPAYPASFWSRIYKYHESHNGKFDVAHDVGAGAGIASQDLAKRFEKVIVSDPNDNYVNIASERLVSQFGHSAAKFNFLQEGGEKSSVGSARVDLIVVCEAIHWMNFEAVMVEFARQIKPGGSLAISHYGRPIMIDNPAAQSAWDKLFDIWTDRNLNRDELHNQCLRKSISGLDTVPFSPEHWEEGVQRIWINSRGDSDSFQMSVRHAKPFASKVGDGDVKSLIEDDEDWIEQRNVQWLKGMFASFIPSIPEEELQDLWDEMDIAVGKGKDVKVGWPVVQLLATKRR
ncbi:uncharacterized protein RSE6_03236 [Rhynchosporium secalis]|uniref:Methyltransferase type 11 domain-containing protein n=1 Tax=Rhynchosporium secalis TaxID=38038 RepID=A0A1E1M297_RHYSE|nr:uncharacterized protein RSE6_03236 [Rhynchosporium secalis]